MNAFQILYRASAPSTWALAVASVLGGTAASSIFGMVNFRLAFVCALFAIFGQIANNFTRCYFGEKNLYGYQRMSNLHDNEEDRLPLPVKNILKEGIYAAGIMALLSGVAIFLYGGIWTLAVAALLMILIVPAFLGHKYISNPEFRYFVTFMIYGPIGVIDTDLLQNLESISKFTGETTFAEIITYWNPIPSLLMSVIFGCMALIVNFVSTARNSEFRSDASKNKRKRLAAYIIIAGIVAGGTGQATPFLLDLPDWWIYLPVPVVGIAINIMIAVGVYKKPESRRWVLMALLNIFWVSVAALIIYGIFGYDSFMSTDSLPFIPSQFTPDF